MRKSIFSQKIISLKHSGVRFCFEAFIETNTTVQSDFDFELNFETMIFLFSKLCACMYFFSLIVSHMHVYTYCQGGVYFTAGRKLGVSNK